MNFKLNKQSRTLIKNFAQINPAMIFRPGNVIRSMSNHQDVIGIASIENTIPARFAIGDLSKFLSVISLYDTDAELSVNEGKTVTIQGSNGRKFEYTLASEKGIKIIEKDEVTMPPVISEFNLSAKDLNFLKKNVLVGGFSHIIFAADGKELRVKASNLNDQTSSVYDAVLCPINKTFNMIFEDRKIANMLEYDYLISVNADIVRFKSSVGVEYYNAPKKGSTFK